MTTGKSIFLVGPMGAGKSTIGRMLAEHLNYQFVDSDAEIEQRTGASISWIFDEEGEEGFRSRECAVIDELTQRSQIVLATGGGAIKSADNRRNLINRGIVLYLHAPVERQFQRTMKDKRRPLLQTENPKATLENLMKQRDPLYREVADYVINTDALSARAVLQNILQILNM